ncbi:protein YIF1B [Chrysoperla carnea]|uniref:protein YIF1B n=1 Tax=Chrysoperla carnea TaxID=189513 RepID=UPI001D093751|nr:protein YIF1B [Chrysoperla carnea]
MNYNSNSSMRHSASRKPKRVVDVNVMGNPIPSAAPTTAPYNPYESFPIAAPNPNSAPLTTDYRGPFPQGPVDQYPQQPFLGNQPQNHAPPGHQPFNVLSQPVVQDMALQYGQQLASTGRKVVEKEIEKYVPVSKLKYYFAVDTKYVVSKLGLLFFPFSHTDWSIKYEQDNPVQPRYEINAPDLYIPVMAYVTYVVVAGLVLGMQDRFTPEQIGIYASSALAWTLVEMAVYMATLYITNIKTSLRTLDILAYSGYKYVGIILSVLISLIFANTGYYIVLLYCSLALAFFLVRALKAQVLSEHQNDPRQTTHYGTDVTAVGSKRRLYFLLFVALTQPLLSWWLSLHLVKATPPPSS